MQTRNIVDTKYRQEILKKLKKKLIKAFLKYEKAEK